MTSISKISLLSPDGRVTRDPKARSLAFFVGELPVLINQQLNSELKQVAIENDNANVRVCLHDAPTMVHQDMIILEHEGNYYPPHRHPGKAETFSVLEGVLGIVCYDKNGEVVDVAAVKKGEIYRLAIPHYHLITPLTPTVIYHESKPGPFLGADDLIVADWAPSFDEVEAAEELMTKALKLLSQEN